MNANPAKGSSNDGFLNTSWSFFGLIPTIPSISIGDGRISITMSSIACTPLFLNAEPHIIGTTFPDIVAALKAFKISRSVKEFSSSKNFSIKDSSNSATASNNSLLNCLASSITSAGISISWNVIPKSASFQVMPLKLIRSTTP